MKKIVLMLLAMVVFGNIFAVQHQGDVKANIINYRVLQGHYLFQFDHAMSFNGNSATFLEIKETDKAMLSSFLLAYSNGYTINVNWATFNSEKGWAVFDSGSKVSFYK